MSEPLFVHDKQLIHNAHHKSGSVWIAMIMSALARKHGLKFNDGLSNDPISKHPSSRFLYSYTSLNAFDHDNYVGSHMVRDPRDIVVSAYFYHQWSEEGWEQTYNPQCKATYQDYLKGLPKSDGIHFEMRGWTAAVLTAMEQWNYDNPRIAEVRYENLITESDDNFRKLFEFWGIHPSHIEDCLEVARSYHMTRQTGRKVGEIKLGTHMRSGKPGQWQEHFDPSHKMYFKMKYGQLLIKLGYETDYNW